jgi:hypothetical protein
MHSLDTSTTVAREESPGPTTERHVMSAITKIFIDYNDPHSGTSHKGAD